MHHPFFISEFTDDESPETKELIDGFTIILFRCDPAQLQTGMYKAWVEENQDDSVIVCLPYLTHGMQFDSEVRSDRTKELNEKGKMVHRSHHELGLSQSLQTVLNSGKKKLISDGFRCTCYRITFPGHQLTSGKHYGAGGVLKLNPCGWKSNIGLKETSIDIQWHVSIVEETKRFAKLPMETGDPDYFADAIEGMQKPDVTDSMTY